MAHEQTVALVMSEHVRDPETFEVFFAGAHNVEEGQASRLLSYHAGTVEESSQVATEAAVEAAEKEGVNIADVEGSGAGGRVTRQDVEKASK